MMFIRLFVFFAGVLLALFLGWAALIGVPGIQIAAVPPQPGLRPYTFEEAYGRQVYIREGCIYCHSQQTRPQGFGADQARMFGRPSVPGDYFYDKPHLLGTMRTGPDLLNIAARQPSAAWHYAHLYNPRMVVPKSVMPRFPWLFDEKTSTDSLDTVVNVPGARAFIVPNRDGRALVAYLLSMNHTYPVQ